jgi:hypothetical protein
MLGCSIMNKLSIWPMTIALSVIVTIAPIAWAESPDNGGSPSASNSSQVLELPSRYAPQIDSAAQDPGPDPAAIAESPAYADDDGEGAATTPAPKFAGTDEYMSQRTVEGAAIAGIPPGVLFGYGPGYRGHVFQFSTGAPFSPLMMPTPFRPLPIGPPLSRFSAPMFNAPPAWGPPAGASFYGSPYISGIPFSHR